MFYLVPQNSVMQDNNSSTAGLTSDPPNPQGDDASAKDPPTYSQATGKLQCNSNDNMKAVLKYMFTWIHDYNPEIWSLSYFNFSNLCCVFIHMYNIQSVARPRLGWGWSTGSS